MRTRRPVFATYCKSITSGVLFGVVKFIALSTVKHARNAAARARDICVAECISMQSYVIKVRNFALKGTLARAPAMYPVTMRYGSRMPYVLATGVNYVRVLYFLKVTGGIHDGNAE